MVHPIERLSTYEGVVAAAGGDPYARWSVAPDAAIQAVAQGGAVMWTVQREHYSDATWASLLGPTAAVAELAAAVLADPSAHGFDPAPKGISVPFGAMELLPDAVRPPDFGDWVWWWTDTPPTPAPGEHQVEELSAAHHDELAALLAVANPDASSAADDARVRTWGAIREGGRLVACGADRPYAHGVAHLASIATRPEARGRGLGTAVTAWLTRRRFIEDEAAVVTLGMYANNLPAAAVYTRLGFRPEHRFTSGDLPTRRTGGQPS